MSNVTDNTNELIHNVTANAQGTWTDENEASLTYIYNEAKIYEQLYSEAMYYYKNINIFILILHSILQYAATLLQSAITSLVYLSTVDIQAMMIVMLSINVIISGLLFIEKKFDCSVKASNCKNIADQYRAFSMKIKLILDVNRINRSNPDYVLMSINTDFETLINHSKDVIIPISVRNSVYKNLETPIQMINGVNVNMMRGVQSTNQPEREITVRSTRESLIHE